MNEVPTRRRWFRFSLRTMFVVVTVVAAGMSWLEYQRDIVEERRQTIKHISSVASSTTFVLFGCAESNWMAEVRSDIPWAWRLLGAQAVWKITLDSDDFSEADVERFSKLFPESCIELNSSVVTVMRVVPPHGQ